MDLGFVPEELHFLIQFHKSVLKTSCVNGSALGVVEVVKENKTSSHSHGKSFKGELRRNMKNGAYVRKFQLFRVVTLELDV